MNAKQALELKQARERTLVELDEMIPEGRKSGELSGLIATAKQAHKLLTRYEGKSNPSDPNTLAVESAMSTAFTVCIDRISELSISTEVK
jgi:hypothetical protein